MPPTQISHPSIVFKNQLRDGVTPIEACAFNATRREFLAVDASALRVWGLKRIIKTIMAPSKVRYALIICTCVLYRTVVHKVFDGDGHSSSKHQVGERAETARR